MRFEGRPHSGLVVGDDRRESTRGSDPASRRPCGPRCSLQLLLLFAAAGLALGGSCPDSMGFPHAVPHSLSVPSQVPQTEVGLLGSSVQPPPPSVDGGLLQ